MNKIKAVNLSLNEKIFMEISFNYILWKPFMVICVTFDNQLYDEN